MLMLVAGFASAQSVDLVLNHGQDLPTINATDTVTFTVTVDNSDPGFTADAANVVLDYQISPTDTLVSVTPSTGCSAPDASNAFSCNLGTLLHGTDTSLDIVVRGTGTGVSNFPYVMQTTATVSTSNNDIDPSNNTEQRNVTVNAGTDLGVVLNSSPGMTPSGGAWTHDIVVDNYGPIDATNAVIHLDLPVGVVVQSVPAGCSVAAPGVVCQVGALSVGDSLPLGSIVTQVAVASGSNLSATALIDSLDQYDGNSINQQSTRQVEVTPGSDLSVGLSHTAGTILEGQPFNLTASPAYTGEVPDIPALVIDVDPGLQILSPANFSQNGWSCSVTGQQVSCSGLDVGSMVPGSSQSLGDVSVQVSGATAGSFAANQAQISADYSVKPDSDLSNNVAGTTPVIESANLNVGINKSPPNRNLRTIGAAYPFDYQIRVRNNGNIAFWGDLTWSDNVPAGLTVTAINGPAGWSCSPALPVTGAATIDCVRTYTEGAPLAVNATQDFTVTAYANGAISGNITNQACLTQIDHDLAFLDNVDPAPCNGATINAQALNDSADLRVVKTASAATVNAGEALTYTLRIVNDGPATASDVDLTDAFSALFTGSAGNSFQGATVTNATASGGTCGTSGLAGNVGSRTLSCNFASIPVCSGTDCPSIEVTVLPLGNTSSGVPLVRNNTASAYSNETADPDYGNNPGSVSTTINPLTDLLVSKDVTVWSGNLGTPLEYRLQIENIGASGASGLSLEDVLPHDLTYLSTDPGASASCATEPGANTTTTTGNDEIACTRSTLPRNATWTVTVNTRPNHGIPAGTTLVNSVDAETDTPETDLSNNADTADAEVGEAVVDLAVIKADTPDPVFVGDRVTYSLRIINNGPSVATDATIYDYLPSAGLRYVENSIRFYDVVGTNLVEIDPGDLAGLGISCSKEPNNNDLGTGYPAQSLDNSYLWPMDTGVNPGYLNGVWDPAQGNLVADADLICNMGLLLDGQSRAITYELEADTRGVYFNYAISRSREHRENGVDGPDVVPGNDVTRERTTVRSVPNVGLSKVSSAEQVSLLEPFDFIITASNLHTDELAYFPEVRDTLPAGMELTAPPVLESGAPVGSSCTGVAGDSDFICSLGDGIPPQAEVVIRVPVRVVAGGAQTLINEAFLHLDTDLEFDEEPPAAAEDDDDVVVVVSSLAGRVYHDNDRSGAYTSGNPPIAGVTLTLTGTSLAGDSITRTTVTEPDGTYLFEELPAGSYSVTQTQPGGWIDGPVTQGSEGGSPSVNLVDNVQLPPDTAAVQYDFGEYLADDLDELASISGHVYFDVNDNGQMNDSEPGIADVVVNLWRDGALIATQRTDDDGVYFFENLAPGTYRVTESQPAEWIDARESVGQGATSPGSSPQNDVFDGVELLGGDVAINYNFGELRNVPPIPTIGVYGLMLLVLMMTGLAQRKRRSLS
ncbi:SdrD B-like domain-containing protein [Halopseudomonas salegens]|nr:SdrD B-like domain-containing protein [Halopseudomonas salegens]